MSTPSPWQGKSREELARQGHDPKRCQVCCPYIDSPAYRRGVEAAERAAKKK